MESLFSSFKDLLGRVNNSVRGGIKKFSDMIISYMPEPIQNSINRVFNEVEEEVEDDEYLTAEEGEEKEEEREKEDFTPIEQETAFDGYLKTYRIYGKKGYGEKTFIKKIKPKVMDLINQQKKPLKVKFILVCKFIKENPNTGNFDEAEPPFHTKQPETITESTDLSNLFDVMTNHQFEVFKKFAENGSGWKLDHVKYIIIKIDPFEPLLGSSYISLPEKIAKKRAVINVKNEKDNKCFKWAVTSAAYPREKNPQRLNREMMENSEKLNWKGIKFPAEWSDIDKFEKQNPYYAINVYGYDNDKGEVYPLRISDKQNGFLINLLLISNDKTNHYCWIKNFSGLIVSQVTKHKAKIYVCYRCFYHTHEKEKLENHKIYCMKNEPVRSEMPMDKYGNPEYIKFINYYKKMRVPFVVYADFESFTLKIHTCSPDEIKSFTKQYQKHKPSGYCYIIKFFDENYETVIRQYTAKSPDEDVGKRFIEELEKDVREIYKNIKPNKKLNWMTQREKFNHKNATHCHICEGELLEKDRVKDHCHYTGKYRGAAHSECNLNYKITKFFIPIIFHNLSGYDSHLFIKNIGITKGKVDCIPNNEEKYISFTKQIVLDKFINKEGKEREVKWDLRFIDSFKFMPTSLSSLVDNLTKCGKCGACKPGDCIKRYIEDEKIVQYKGIGNCEKCKNCLLAKSKCLSPKDEKLTETKKEIWR